LQTYVAETKRGMPTPKATPPVSQPWRIIPITVIEGKKAPSSGNEAGPGWKFIYVKLAVENASDVPQSLQLDYDKTIYKTKIATAEGYSYYPFSEPAEYPLNWIGTGGYSLPGGFRVWQIAPAGACSPYVVNIWYSNGLAFKVAENSHGYQLLVPGFEPVNLDAARQISFPTDLPRNRFYDIGATIPIGNKGAIQVLRFEKPKGEGQVEALLTVLYTNASGGYDQAFSLDYSIIGNDGVLRPEVTRWSSVVVGPGQKLEYPHKFCISPDAQDLKLIITGDIHAVFNLD